MSADIRMHNSVPATSRRNDATQYGQLRTSRWSSGEIVRFFAQFPSIIAPIDFADHNLGRMGYAGIICRRFVACIAIALVISLFQAATASQPDSEVTEHTYHIVLSNAGNGDSLTATYVSDDPTEVHDKSQPIRVVPGDKVTVTMSNPTKHTLARSSVLDSLLYSWRIVGPFPRDIMALALRTFSVLLSREEHLKRQSSVPHFTWIP